MLIAFVRDGDANPAPPQGDAELAAAISFVGYQSFGTAFGVSSPARLTPPLSNRASATVASCCWPGVSTKVINCPFPSTRTCSLVLNPPWLRPNASLAGSLFLPPRRADVPEQSCHPQNALPSPVGPSRPPVLAGLPGCGPIVRYASIGRNDWPPWTMSHSVRANHARALLYEWPRGCH